MVFAVPGIGAQGNVCIPYVQSTLPRRPRQFIRSVLVRLMLNRFLFLFEALAQLGGALRRRPPSAAGAAAFGGGGARFARRTVPRFARRASLRMAWLSPARSFARGQHIRCDFTNPEQVLVTWAYQTVGHLARAYPCGLLRRRGRSRATWLGWLGWLPDGRADQVGQAPFGTFMFVPNGPRACTSQVAYQTLGHLGSTSPCGLGCLKTEGKQARQARHARQAKQAR